MKRILFLLMLMIPSWAQAKPCWGQAPPARSAPQVQPFTATSVLVVNPGTGALGSGTVIARQDGKALVLTAYHVVVGQGAAIKFPSGNASYGILVGVDPATDLAVLAVDSPSGAVMRISETEPTAGETIWLAGYPHGNGPNARKGKVLSYKTVIFKGASAPRRVLGLDVWSDAGDSGCGICRPDGTLCGVLSGGVDGNHRDTCVTGLADIRQFLETRCAKWFPRLRQPGSPPLPAQPPTPAIPAGPGVPPLDPVAPGLSTLLAKALADIEELKSRAAGRDGKDGLPGRDGKDGLPGKDGRGGKDADAAGLLAEIAELKKLIAGLQGQPAPNPSAPGPVRVRVVPATKE